MEINNVLSKLLFTSGLKQSEAADQLKIPRSRLSEWINKTREIRFSKLQRIAKGLGYKIEIIIKKI